jgi:hypothetical protein
VIDSLSAGLPQWPLPIERQMQLPCLGDSSAHVLIFFFCQINPAFLCMVYLQAPVAMPSPLLLFPL